MNSKRESHVMSKWEPESILPRELVWYLQSTSLLTPLYWNCAINNFEDILLKLSLDSAPSSFTQVWQLPKTDNSYSSVQNAVKSAELYHEQVLPHHFLFLDNNGDELAEHWWPLEDTRCKRLTDPPCHFNLLVKPRFSPLCVLIWFFREDVFLVAERHKV